jgi:hypothetical protein
MTYSELIIQASSEAHGITREEAMHWLRISENMLPHNNPQRLNQQKAQEILADLRKDIKGVLAWGEHLNK